MKRKNLKIKSRNICVRTFCISKKLLVFSFSLLFILTFLYYYKYVDAQVNFQGVQAGMPSVKKFLCDPKTGEAKQAGKFDFTPMTEQKTGGGGATKVTYCPTGTCDSATNGSKSTAKDPFTKKEIMGANQVKMQGGKKMCVKGEKAEQEGNKKMDFPTDEKPPEKPAEKSPDEKLLDAIKRNPKNTGKDPFPNSGEIPNGDKIFDQLSPSGQEAICNHRLGPAFKGCAGS